MTDTILEENVSWFSRGKKEKVDNRPAKLNEKKVNDELLRVCELLVGLLFLLSQWGDN